ncbi:MAG: hypothetical protein IPJ97_05695 [Proteobacteria bacterium]|nr:hypothetical protein [Pseudomonadota bacterium]
MDTHPHRWIAAIVLGTLLAGCEGTFTIDLSTDGPADPAIADVQANLLGVELRKSDSTVTTLEFRDSESVDLRDLATASTPLRLFTSETLRTGDYTESSPAVRLRGRRESRRCAWDHFSLAARGRQFRCSRLLGRGGRAQLRDVQPRARPAPVAGVRRRHRRVHADTRAAYRSDRRCRAGHGHGRRDLSRGQPVLESGAVYLHKGTGVEPDDLDHAGVEPFATARIVQDVASGGVPTYSLRFLPAGDYTIAFTCRGDADALGANDDVVFSNAQNVSLDDGEAMRLDLG